MPRIVTAPKTMPLKLRELAVTGNVNGDTMTAHKTVLNIAETA